MARARNIKPAFFLNEMLAKVSFQARLLFIGLWCLADCEGRLEDRPMRIKASLFPYEELDVDQLLEELASSPEKFIVRYAVGTNRYIQVQNFTRHQNPSKKERESGSRIPSCTVPDPNQFDPGTVPERIQNGTGSADILIPDIPYTDSLTPETEIDASASVSECDQFVEQGVHYLLSLNSPNLFNVGWVRGYLGIQFRELESKRPDLRKPEILACWQDTCDLAVHKNATAPQWFKTTFQNKLATWRPEQNKTPAHGPASSQARDALLEFPFIRHTQTGEVFPAEKMEVRSESPATLFYRGNSFPVGMLEGLQEVPE